MCVQLHSVHVMYSTLMHYACAIYGVKWDYVALADVDCFGANAMPQRCQACTRRVGVPGEFFRNGTPTLTKKATLSMEKNLAPQKLNTTKQPNLRNG